MVRSPAHSDFPIQNIPFGVFLTKDDVITVGTRIGDYAIDLGALQQLNYFEGIELTDDMFMQDTLNDFISDGKNMAFGSKSNWRYFRRNQSKIKRFNKSIEILLFLNGRCRNATPVLIGDYTDFYSSKEH
jgi:fumarylacetoacetase